MKYYFLLCCVFLFMGCSSDDDAVLETPEPTTAELIVGNWKLVGWNYDATPVDLTTTEIQEASGFGKDFDPNSVIRFRQNGTYLQDYQYTTEVLILNQDGSSSTVEIPIVSENLTGTYTVADNSFALDLDVTDRIANGSILDLDENVLVYSYVDDEAFILVGTAETFVVATFTFYLERIN